MIFLSLHVMLFLLSLSVSFPCNLNCEINKQINNSKRCQRFIVSQIKQIVTHLYIPAVDVTVEVNVGLLQTILVIVDFVNVRNFTDEL